MRGGLPLWKRTYAGNLRAGTPHAGNQAERNPLLAVHEMPPGLPQRSVAARGRHERSEHGQIFKDRCLNWIESGTMCMTCYDRCPLRGEGMVLDMGYVPAVGESCVGCGMCEYVCPKNAVAVVPDVQKKGGKA